MEVVGKKVIHCVHVEEGAAVVPVEGVAAEGVVDVIV